MGIGENITQSFGFAQEALVGKWVRWIMLVIASLFFPVMYGYTVRVMRGIEPNYEEESFFGLFIDGIKLMVINFLYMLVPLIVFAFTVGLTIIGIILKNGDMSSVLSVILGLIGGLVLTLILAFIFGLLGIIGSVRFARTGSMEEAFAFGEITNTIGKIGWINYILSLIVFFIVIFLIIAAVTIIQAILGIIPILGWIVAFIISLFVGPFISLMASRFYSILYDEGV